MLSSVDTFVIRPFVSSVLPLPRCGVAVNDCLGLCGYGLGVAVFRPFNAIEGLGPLGGGFSIRKRPGLPPFCGGGTSMEGATASSIASSMLDVSIAFECLKDHKLAPPLEVSSMMSEEQRDRGNVQNSS